MLEGKWVPDTGDFTVRVAGAASSGVGRRLSGVVLETTFAVAIARSKGVEGNDSLSCELFLEFVGFRRPEF